MADLTFVHYTGEPVRQQPARIARAVWEEKKSQIVDLFLIHTLSLFLGQLQGFGFRRMMTVFLFYPKGYGLSLAGVYVVWMLVILILYPFCRWVAAVKSRRRDWWLSYL